MPFALPNGEKPCGTAPLAKGTALSAGQAWPGFRALRAWRALRALKAVEALAALAALVALAALTGCGQSSPATTAPDLGPLNHEAAAKQLNTAQLVEIAASNPRFSVTDERGMPRGIVSLSAGKAVTSLLPLCPTAIPGPLAACIPKGAKVVNGRLSFGVAAFGGETGLYFIDQARLCFSRLTTIEGCYALALRPDKVLEARSTHGDQSLWIENKT